MKRTRMLGVVLVLVAIVVMYLFDGNDGYSDEVATGMLSAIGVFLILMGRFKFWEDV